MIDLSSIGSAGLILQYEDIVSMVGYNVAKFFKGNGVSEKLDNTSITDVLSSYVNRDDEAYAKWLNNEYGIVVNPLEMLNSKLAMQPSLLYSYKVFQTAAKDNKNNLFIYSDKYSPMVEQTIKSYGVDGVTYIHDDIIDFLHDHPNCTYITASYDNICRCVNELNAPVCLVVCEDYTYTSKIVTDHIDKRIIEKPNIFLRYTSVLSAGIIG